MVGVILSCGRSSFALVIGAHGLRGERRQAHGDVLRTLRTDGVAHPLAGRLVITALLCTRPPAASPSESSEHRAGEHQGDLAELRGLRTGSDQPAGAVMCAHGDGRPAAEWSHAPTYSLMTLPPGTGIRVGTGTI